MKSLINPLMPCNTQHKNPIGNEPFNNHRLLITNKNFTAFFILIFKQVKSINYSAPSIKFAMAFSIQLYKCNRLG